VTTAQWPDEIITSRWNHPTRTQEGAARHQARGAHRELVHQGSVQDEHCRRGHVVHQMQVLGGSTTWSAN
jgi:hypothetical protein